VTQRKNVSDATARTIDEEVKRVVEEGEEKAREILTEHLDDLHKLATGLLEYETLTLKDIQALLRGETLDRSDQDETPGGAGASVPTSGPKDKGEPIGDLEPEPQPGG
jgi:cell division protease FtsH